MEVTCGIFLYDAVNQKLLATRAYGGRPFERLSIPKGLFDEGKDSSYLEAAIRELEEETSISIYDYVEDFTDDNLFEFEIVPYTTQQKKLKAFLVTVNTDLSNVQPFCMSFFEKDGEQYPEISEYYWLSLDEAKSRLHETQSQLIPHLLKILFP